LLRHFAGDAVDQLISRAGQGKGQDIGIHFAQDGRQRASVDMNQIVEINARQWRGARQLRRR
jgi:hypothetical protein